MEEVTCVARGVVIRAPDQGVVAEPAVERIVAASAIEPVGLLVADDLVRPGGASDVLDADQRISRNVSERETEMDRLELVAGAIGEIKSKMNDHGVCDMERT